MLNYSEFVVVRLLDVFLDKSQIHQLHYCHFEIKTMNHVSEMCVFEYLHINCNFVELKTYGIDDSVVQKIV